MVWGDAVWKMIVRRRKPDHPELQGDGQRDEDADMLGNREVWQSDGQMQKEEKLNSPFRGMEIG